MSSTSIRKKFRWRSIQPYLFISPFFILYAIFGIYPLISGVNTAMHLSGAFVGMQNFVEVIQDELFWKAIQNAFLYMLGSIFIILPVAMLAALLLSSRFLRHGRGLITTVYFFPNVTSVIVIGIVFRLLLKTQNGTINTLLQTLGLIRKPLKWLSDPDLAIPSLVMLGIWRFFGINSLYFLSGLQGIPTDLLEAARIDGCTAWKEFWRIKFPLLKPIMTYVVFTAIIGSFSITGEVYSLVGIGGTGTKYSFLFPVVYLYNSMFRDGKMNQATAMGYVLALILLVLTIIQRSLFADRDEGRKAKV